MTRTLVRNCRATLLLVPLLGLQYILTPFRPAPGHAYEAAYEGK
jgi:calcitonin receptor-like